MPADRQPGRPPKRHPGRHPRRGAAESGVSQAELGSSGVSLLRQASGQAPRGDPEVTEPDPPRALADLRLMHAGARARRAALAKTVSRLTVQETGTAN